MSSIKFSADLDTSRLEAAIKRSNVTVGNWAKGIEKETSGIDSALMKVGGAFAAYFSVTALTGFAKKIIEVRGEFQQLGIAFEVMLQSKGRADAMMRDAVEFAEKTPFTLTDVAGNIKLLMAMGVAAEDSIITLKTLGDVASGVGAPLQRVALNYGQVLTMGKLQGRELRDFQVQGIPILEELARMYGTNKKAIGEMVEAGSIGFEDVRKAFANMAGEGGKFNNLMERQMASVTGQLSNLKDKVDIMFNDIGQSNEGLINMGIAGVSDLVANYKKVADVLGILITTYGAYKVAGAIVGKWHLTEKALLEEKIAALYSEAEARKVAATKAAAEEQKLAMARAAEQADLARQQAAETKVTAARERLAIATANLAAAERAYATAAAETGAAYASGAIGATDKQILLKKELAVVEAARMESQTAAGVLDKAITEQTVIDEGIKTRAAEKGATERIALTEAEDAAKLKTAATNTVVTGSEVRLTMAKRLSAQAQALLNATMLNNPYVLAAAALGGLAYWLYKTLTYQTELEKALRKSNIELENEQDKAAMLFAELKNTATQTEKWKEIKKQIIDQYGQYIPKQLQELDTYEKQDLALKELNKSLKENLTLKGKQEAQEAIIKDTNEKLEKARGTILKVADRNLTPEQKGEIRAWLTNVISSYKAGISSITGKQLGGEELNKELTNSQEAFIKNFAKSFKGGESNLSMAKITRNIADIVDALRNYKTEMDSTGAAYDKLGAKQDEAKKKELEYSNAISEKKKILAALKQAEHELKNLEEGWTAFEVPKGSTATPAVEAIAAKRKEIADLKDKLDIKAKDERKAKKDAETTQKELYEFEIDLGQKRIENQFRIEQSLLDVGIVNKDRAKDLINEKYEYDVTMAKKSRDERIKILNENKAPEAPVITELPLTEQKDYNDKIIKAAADRDERLKGIATATSDFVIETERGTMETYLKIGENSVILQKAKIDKNYREAVAGIQAAAETQLRELNLKKGGLTETGKKVESKYVESLPIKEQRMYDNMLLAEREKRDNALVALDREAAKEMKRIMQDVYGVTMTASELEEQKINDKYDEKLEKIKALDHTQADIDRLEAGRKKEIANSQMQIAFNMSEFYSKLFGDLSTYGYGTLKQVAAELEQITSNAKKVWVNGEMKYEVDTGRETVSKEGQKVKEVIQMTAEEYIKFQKQSNDVAAEIRKENPFEAVIDSVNKLKTAIKGGDKNKVTDAIGNIATALQNSGAKVSEWGDALDKSIGGGAGKAVKSLGELVSGIGKVGEGAAKVASGNITGLVDVFAGAGQIVELFTRGEKAFREAQKKYLEEVIKLQLELNGLMLDELQIRAGANVFINDYAKDAFQQALAIQKANTLMNQQVKDLKPRDVLSEIFNVNSRSYDKWAQAVSGIKKDATDLEKYLSTLAIQTGVYRTSFLGITTGHHAAFGSLLKEYPKLIDANGEFDEEVGKLVLNMGDAVPAATRKALEALIKYQEQIEESKKAIEDSVSSIAGFISGNLASALIDAWDNGSNAFDAFKESVTMGLRDIVSQMVYNQVFGEAFTKLETNMKESLSLAGDQSFVDDFQKFFSQAPDLINQWQTGIKEAESQAEKAGFDFEKYIKNDPQKGLTGEISRLTEETGTELAGLARRNADDIRVIRDTNRAGVLHLVAIENNTFNTVEELKKVNLELQAINSNTKPTFSGKI